MKFKILISLLLICSVSFAEVSQSKKTKPVGPLSEQQIKVFTPGFVKGKNFELDPKYYTSQKGNDSDEYILTSINENTEYKKIVYSENQERKITSLLLESEFEQISLNQDHIIGCEYGDCTSVSASDCAKVVLSKGSLDKFEKECVKDFRVLMNSNEPTSSGYSSAKKMLLAHTSIDSNAVNGYVKGSSIRLLIHRIELCRVLDDHGINPIVTAKKEGFFNQRFEKNSKKNPKNVIKSLENTEGVK